MLTKYWSNIKILELYTLDVCYCQHLGMQNIQQTNGPKIPIKSIIITAL